MEVGSPLLESLAVSMLEVVLLHLVVLAVMRAWLMGSIFGYWRSYFQARGGRLGELLDCPLCLSYHVAFWAELLFLVPLKIYAAAWFALALSPLVVFAAAGAAQSAWFKYHKDWQ